MHKWVSVNYEKQNTRNLVKKKGDTKMLPFWGKKAYRCNLKILVTSVPKRINDPLCKHGLGVNIVVPSNDHLQNVNRKTDFTIGEVAAYWSRNQF